MKKYGTYLLFGITTYLFSATLFAQTIDIYTPIMQYGLGTPNTTHISTNIGIAGERLMIGSVDNFQYFPYDKTGSQSISYVCIKPTSDKYTGKVGKRIFWTTTFFKREGSSLTYFINPTSGNVHTKNLHLGSLQKYLSGTMSGTSIYGRIFSLGNVDIIPSVSCKFNEYFDIGNKDELTLNIHVQVPKNSKIALGNKELIINNNTSTGYSIDINRIIDINMDKWKSTTSLRLTNGTIITSGIVNGQDMNWSNMAEDLSSGGLEGLTIPGNTDSIIVKLTRKN